MASESVSIVDIVAEVLALIGAGEVFASQIASSRRWPHARLTGAVLFWEGVAVLTCASVLYMRRDFGLATIVSIVALWLAGGAVGLLRGGIFDKPQD